MDVFNDFLHSDLDEEIYMSLSQGYTPGIPDSLPPNDVCRLHKSLYGLKQASMQWNQTFTNVLLADGFTQSVSDTTLFVKETPTGFLALLIYVDDIVIASNNPDDLAHLKVVLSKAFKIKDLGPLHFFLGFEIARSSKGISVCQRKYTLDILEDVRLLSCKPSSIPMDPYTSLSKESGQPLESANPYRELIGRLLYLTITRPDITFAVQKLSQFMHAPTDVHLHAGHRVLKYLKGNPGLGLFYVADSELCLNTFADANWTSCPDSRRSTSEYCVYLAHLSFVGNPENKRWSAGVVLRLRIGASLMLLGKFCGSNSYLETLRSLSLTLPSSIVTISLLYTLPPILFFMNARSMWKLIVTPFVIRSRVATLSLFICLVIINWQTY